MQTPTLVTYTELQQAYSFFNSMLFAGTLPDCIITLQRNKKTYGYFSPNRFTSREGIAADEIALNPTYFATRTIKQVLSTLVHEMCHSWQHRFGKPGRGRYHNKEWAEKMESVGLMPTDTGKPDGKKTGDRVTHMIIENSAFDHACDQLLTDNYRISWVDRFAEIPAGNASVDGVDAEELRTMKVDLQGSDPTEVRSQSRAKYSHTCSGNKNFNVWGKRGLGLACTLCGEVYEEVEP